MSKLDAIRHEGDFFCDEDGGEWVILGGDRYPLERGTIALSRCPWISDEDCPGLTGATREQSNQAFFRRSQYQDMLSKGDEMAEAILRPDWLSVPVFVKKYKLFLEIQNG